MVSIHEVVPGLIILLISSGFSDMTREQKKSLTDEYQRIGKLANWSLDLNISNSNFISISTHREPSQVEIDALLECFPTGSYQVDRKPKRTDFLSKAVLEWQPVYTFVIDDVADLIRFRFLVPHSFES